MTEKGTASGKKYDSRFCQDIIEYFEETLKNRGKKGILHEIPSFTGYSRKIGVCMTSIRNWRKKYQKFDEACRECEEMLKDAIVGDSLLFRMNGQFAKYILAARYGIIEKIEYTGNAEGSIEVTPELKELLTVRKRRLEDENKR